MGAVIVRGENDCDRTTTRFIDGPRDARASSNDRRRRRRRGRKTGNYCSNKHVSLISERPTLTAPPPSRHAAAGPALIKSSHGGGSVRRGAPPPGRRNIVNIRRLPSPPPLPSSGTPSALPRELDDRSHPLRRHRHPPGTSPTNAAPSAFALRNVLPKHACRPPPCAETSTFSALRRPASLYSLLGRRRSVARAEASVRVPLDADGCRVRGPYERQGQRF